MKKHFLLLVALLAVCGGAYAGKAEIDDIRHLARLAPTHNMGSPGRKAIDKYVSERFAASGFEHGKITFETPVLYPGKAELHLPDGTTVPLHSMAPNVVHPGNLPEHTWEGRLVDMSATQASLEDAAVLLGIDTRQQWMSALERGGSVLIFAGKDNVTWRDAVMTFTKVPLTVPRFYLAPADAELVRRKLGEAGSTDVTLVQVERSRWKLEEVANDWVVIPGDTYPDIVVHIQAYKDAASFAPALSPGAEGIANLALLFRLFDRFCEERPKYTLVFSAVNDHCNWLRGESFYTGYVFPEMDVLEIEIEKRQQDLVLAEFYQKVYADKSPDHISNMRTASTKAAGRVVDLKDPIVRELEYRRNRLGYEKLYIDRELRRPETPAEKKARLEEQLWAMRTEKEDLIAVHGLFRKWGKQLQLEDLTAEQSKKLLDLMDDMEKRYRHQVADAKEGLDRIRNNSRLRLLLEGKRPLLCMTLDVSFGNETMGLFCHGADIRADRWQEGVLELQRLALACAGEMKDGDRYFEPTLLRSGDIWRNHLPARFVMAATVPNSACVPSVTFSTTGDIRDVRFTPRDTLKTADTARMGRMMGFTEELLGSLLQHDSLRYSTREPSPRNYYCYNVRYNLRKIDPFSVDVPTEPVREALVVNWFWNKDFEVHNQPELPVAVGQVNSSYQLAMSNRQGRAMYRALFYGQRMEAFAFDEDYTRIRAAVDLGAGARRFPPLSPPSIGQWDWDEHITVMFPCVQTDLVGLFAPDDRRDIESIIVLDATRESSPIHYGVAGVLEKRSSYQAAPPLVGAACVFTDLGVPIKIVADELLLLNASEEEPEGTGYRAGDPSLRRISYTAAQDVQLLTSARMELIQSRGVKNASAAELHGRAEELLDEADKEREMGREARFVVTSTEALSKAMRSYSMVRGTTTDLIKAVAAFLALVFPFCIFMMKLVTPWSDIRIQVTIFMLIFACTALALALLHPAFSISQTPMMVLLAFLMLGISVFVMYVLYSRFDSGLKRSVEEAQGVESSEQSRSTLAGVAFSVGVNNMRRRRIRTTLTSATIVLVTFTMLSVISVGQAITPFQRKTGKKAPYNGVFFAQPGMNPITEAQMTHFCSLLEPRTQVVRRTWTQGLDRFGGYARQTINRIDDPERTLQANSLLGLEVKEDGFLAEMPVSAGRWFSSDDAREILLSEEAASYLGISAEGFQPVDLSVLNHKLKLVGLLDNEKIAEIRDMAQMPLLPLEALARQVTAATEERQSFGKMTKDAMAGPVPNPEPLPVRYCAFVPIGFAVSLPNTSWRSIAAKAPDPKTAWAAGNHFVSVTGLLAYTGVTGEVSQEDGTKLEPGQYALGPSVGTGIGGVSKVVIPICLAATIILNTMLGAVMERRREIAIYNSIGLNPTHVFVFFVAEALVFGTLGAVAGYLIGQALAQVIVHFGWLPGVNLNFSSTAVIVVIFAAIVTVIISTLYPALIATRAAVPSGQRRWKLPSPEGDELHLDFPFSFAERQLPGVCAFLHDYMDLNSEASSGTFLAQDARFGYVRDGEGRRVLTMVYSITPTPFDLGVNQRLEVYGYYQPRVRAYVLAMYATRLKGDKSSWMLVNQPFMESLRSRLLNWRSQSEQNQEGFRQKGEAMFASSGEFATRAET